MRHAVPIRPLVVVAVLAATVAAVAPAAAEEEGEAVELPPRVRRVLDQHAEAKREAQASYLEEVNRLDEILLRALKRDFSRAMKAEDLPLALAIKREIAAVEEARPKRDFLGNPIPAAGGDPVQVLLAQPWNAEIPLLGPFEVVFHEDGTFDCPRVGSGTWTHEPSRSRFVLVWKGRSKDRDTIVYNLENTNWTLHKARVGKVPFIAQEPEPEEGEGGEGD